MDAGIFTLAMSIGYSALFIALDRIFSTGDRPISWTMALHPLVNAILAPAFFWFMHRWSEAWEIFPTVR